jgi:hypothetical protein
MGPEASSGGAGAVGRDALERGAERRRWWRRIARADEHARRVIPGLGNPVDGRLDRTHPQVTADGTLFVTDFVFSNPNGARARSSSCATTRRSSSCGSRTSATTTSTS